MINRKPSQRIGRSIGAVAGGPCLVGKSFCHQSPTQSVLHAIGVFPAPLGRRWSASTGTYCLATIIALFLRRRASYIIALLAARSAHAARYWWAASVGLAVSMSAPPGPWNREPAFRAPTVSTPRLVRASAAAKALEWAANSA